MPEPVDLRVVAATKTDLMDAVPAGAMLGVPRKTLYDKLARHRINPKDFR